MHDDLRRSGGGGGCAEVTAFSIGMSSGCAGWVAASSMIGAAGKARVGGELDWSIRAVGELGIAAQEWHPSETQDTALSRSRANR